MFFRSEAEQAFDVDVIESQVMDTVIKKCAAVYAGEPLWKDVKNGIRTINFAKSLSSETARLGMAAAADGRGVFQYPKMGGIWLCVWNGSHQAEREYTGCIHAG